MNTESVSPDTSPLLELSDIRKSYPAVDGGITPGLATPLPEVLRGISLTVDTGESLAIIGPSGSGKSTLLNIIGALIEPTSGRVNYEGQDIYAKDETELAAFRNRCIGFIFQSHHLLPQCSALENVLIPTLVCPDDELKASAPKRARELLDNVGLADRIAHRPGQMSGGECQRVAVVRALINKPKVILADEPTGSLDEESAEQLGNMLAALNRDHGVTLMTVTHSLTLAAQMQRGYMLRRGELELWSSNE